MLILSFRKDMYPTETANWQESWKDRWAEIRETPLFFAALRIQTMRPKHNLLWILRKNSPPSE